MPKKLTNQEFINRAMTKHGNVYDYSKTNYVNAFAELEIICKKHGSFFRTPEAHLRGLSGCPYCGTEKHPERHFRIGKETSLLHNKNRFIEKANKTHSKKFDYSRINYVNMSTKIEIMCPTHGVFWAKPYDHIRHAGSGCCLGCYNEKTTKENSSHRYHTDGFAQLSPQDKFIFRATEKFGDKFDYSLVNYINEHTKVIVICKEHGNFEVSPDSFLTNNGSCLLCAATSRHIKTTKSQEQFVQECKDRHGDKYDYSKAVYVGDNDKIIIICKKHGEFKQQAGQHSRGQGCRKCYVDKRTGQSSAGGYSEEFFELHPNRKNDDAKIYLVEFEIENDHFYKLGITIKSLHDRFYHRAKLSRYKKILEVDLPLYIAYQKEQYLLNQLKDYRFYPNFKFGGYTECLKIDVNVKNTIERYLK